MPRDPHEVTLSFKVIDVIEDTPEKLERLAYHVSIQIRFHSEEALNQSDINPFSARS